MRVGSEKEVRPPHQQVDREILDATVAPVTSENAMTIFKNIWNNRDAIRAAVALIVAIIVAVFESRLAG